MHRTRPVWALKRDEVQGHVAALRTAVTAAELLITAHAHASHAFRSLAMQWCELCEPMASVV